MNYHYGFFDAPAVPAYPNSTPAMKPAIYFIEPPCLADANYECLGCDTATLRNNGLHLNCGYLIPSYHKRVVFIDRSPAECYNSFRVLWIGEKSLP